MWFDRDIFKNLIDEKDEDADLDRMVENFKKKGAKVIGEGSDKKETKVTKKETKETKHPAKEETVDSDYSSEEKDEETDSDSDDSNYDIETEVHVPVNDKKKDGFEIVKKTTGNILTMTHLILYVQSYKKVIIHFVNIIYYL